MDALIASIAERQQSEDRMAIGRYLNNLGMLLAPESPDEAEAHFKEASRSRGSGRGVTGLPGPRWQLGRAENNLATLLLNDVGRLDQGETLLQRACKRLEALAAEFPKIPQYRRGWPRSIITSPSPSDFGAIVKSRRAASAVP